MSLEVPCILHTLSSNSCEVPLASIFVIMGIKWAIFVSRSTTTRTVSNPLDFGSSMMNFIDIDCHSLLGTGKGLRVPWSFECHCLLCWHVSHVPTYLLM